jgi:hypothetical protein
MPNLVIDWLRPNKRLHPTPLSRPQDRGFFEILFRFDCFRDLTAALVKRESLGRSQSESLGTPDCSVVSSIGMPGAHAHVVHSNVTFSVPSEVSQHHRVMPSLVID